MTSRQEVGRGLLDVHRLVVPAAAVSAAHDHLRIMGRAECEGMALWTGHVDAGVFTVTETIIPAQRALRTEHGVCIVVDGDELFRLNVYLFNRGLRIGAQLHSHPTDAFHSTTDDTYPIATAAGSFSFVIPDFAQDPFSLPRCAVYRLTAANEWIELATRDVTCQVCIVDDASLEKSSR